ncbi:MAG: hypothetical protein AB7O21_03760 [Gammaproteobacteria bacterium]
MMQTFESLIRAPAQTLVQIFLPLRERMRGDGEARRAHLAQLLGLNVAQLVCGVGFNASLPRVPDLVRFLGYPHPAALLAERNYLFIHDRYRSLSVNDIVEIYAALGAVPEASAEAGDLVISRLAELEAQLEETINPILVGGYRLEVRGIYESHLAVPVLVNSRLGAEYAVLRDITNESMIMLETGAVAPADFLRHPGVTAEEKSRAIFQRLISAQEVDRYLAENPEAPEAPQLRTARGGAA